MTEPKRKKTGGRKPVTPNKSTQGIQAKPGRPAAITEAIAAELCSRMAGGNSLRAVCAAEDMPSASIVFRHLAKSLEFREQYTRAREASADAIFEEMLHIADTPQLGVKTKIRDDGSEETTQGDMIEHRRLQVEARKWALAKLHPKKYGDRVQVERDGKGDFTLTELLATMRSVTDGQ